MCHTLAKFVKSKGLRQDSSPSCIDRNQRRECRGGFVDDGCQESRREKTEIFNRF